MSWTPANSVARYDQFDVTISLIYDSGKIAMPVSRDFQGNPQPVQVVSTKSPTCKKIVGWKVTRTGAVPDLPDPRPTDTNLVLQHVELNPMNALTTDENVYQYTISGVYEYIMLTPPWEETAVPNIGAVGIGPHDDKGLTAAFYPTSAFVTGLIPV